MHDHDRAPRAHATIFRTDRPRLAEFALAGVAAGVGVAYMAAGEPPMDGALGVAFLAGTGVALAGSFTAAWRSARTAATPVQITELRGFAGRNASLPKPALTCENEDLNEPDRRAAELRAGAGAGALSGAAVPADY